MAANLAPCVRAGAGTCAAARSRVVASSIPSSGWQRPRSGQRAGRGCPARWPGKGRSSGLGASNRHALPLPRPASLRRATMSNGSEPNSMASTFRLWPLAPGWWSTKNSVGRPNTASMQMWMLVCTAWSETLNRGCCAGGSISCVGPRAQQVKPARTITGRSWRKHHDRIHGSAIHACVPCVRDRIQNSASALHSTSSTSLLPGLRRSLANFRRMHPGVFAAQNGRCTDPEPRFLGGSKVAGALHPVARTNLCRHRCHHRRYQSRVLLAANRGQRRSVSPGRLGQRLPAPAVRRRFDRRMSVLSRWARQVWTYAVSFIVGGPGF